MSKCARCNWDWFKHKHKNQCPNMPRNPDGTKPKFKSRKAVRK